MIRLAAGLVSVVFVAVLAGCGPPNYVMMTDDMAPTIERGDIIAIDLQAYDHRPPRRGERVAYRAPGERGERLRMGRVVATAGDEVRVTGGALHLNGDPVEEPFVAATMDYEFEALTLPDGHLYILGDNRNEAHDSHVFGPVPIEAVEGRITDVQKPPGSGG
ncbi:MAG: signal peptidase I [Armatimonadota bacterium]